MGTPIRTVVVVFATGRQRRAWKGLASNHEVEAPLKEALASRLYEQRRHEDQPASTCEVEDGYEVERFDALLLEGVQLQPGGGR